MSSESSPVAVPGSSRLPIWQRAGVRQLIKFCIVGASSTVIDKGLLYLFTIKMMVLTTMPWVPWFTWNTLTFCLAVSNGYIWNRYWTFRAHEHTARGQYVKFFVTNAVGLVLNLIITKIFLIAFSGKMLHGLRNPDPQSPDDRLHLRDSFRHDLELQRRQILDI